MLLIFLTSTGGAAKFNKIKRVLKKRVKNNNRAQTITATITKFQIAITIF